MPSLARPATSAFSPSCASRKALRERLARTASLRVSSSLFRKEDNKAEERRRGRCAGAEGCGRERTDRIILEVLYIQKRNSERLRKYVVSNQQEGLPGGGRGVGGLSRTANNSSKKQKKTERETEKKCLIVEKNREEKRREREHRARSDGRFVLSLLAQKTK